MVDLGPSLHDAVDDAYIRTSFAGLKSSRVGAFSQTQSVTRKPVPGDACTSIVKQHDSHFAPLPNLPTILARFGVCLGIRTCLIGDTNGSNASFD